MNLFKKISIAVLILILAVVGYFYYALFINPKSPQGTAVFDKDDLKMEVTYYRPYKKGRLYSVMNHKEPFCLMENIGA